MHFVQRAYEHTQQSKWKRKEKERERERWRTPEQVEISTHSKKINDKLTRWRRGKSCESLEKIKKIRKRRHQSRTKVRKTIMSAKRVRAITPVLPKYKMLSILHIFLQKHSTSVLLNYWLFLLNYWLFK